MSTPCAPLDILRSSTHEMLQGFRRNALRLSLLILGALAAAVHTCAQAPQSYPVSPAGIAWRVTGQWQDADNGQSIVNGSLIRLGTLLRPRNPDQPNSLTLLLADGQRILEECFTARDCSRGFRVPALTASPTPFEIQMLVRISGVLLKANAPHLLEWPVEAYATPPRQEEVTATIVPVDNASSYEAHVAGILSTLSSGRYTCDIHKLGQPTATAVRTSWQKSSPEATFPIPSPGLYEIVIRDSLETPRINLFLAALSPQQQEIATDFLHAKDILVAWNEEDYGWPVHTLLRSYLESLYAGPPAR